MIAPGAALTGGSRIADRVRAEVRVFGIDLRRCGGYWPLPLALAIVWFLNANIVSRDPVFWQQMSTATMQSYVVLGPFAAGIAAWRLGRDRRRQMDDLLASTASSVERRDLMAIAVGAGWGLIAYVIVGTFYLGQAVLRATWGGPDLVLIAVGVLAIVLYAALGALIARLPLGRFAPLVAVALTASIAGITDSIRTADQHQPFRTLSPWGLENLQDDRSMFYTYDWQQAAFPWLLGLLGAALAIALLLRGRSYVRIGLLAGSVAVAVSGAIPLREHEVWGDPVASRAIAFTWSCTTRPAVEVCVHPAWASKRDATADQFAAMLAPIAGLPGVPTRAQQLTPYHETPPGTVPFWQLHPLSVVDSVGSFLGTVNDAGQTRAEITILAWLAQNAGLAREDQFRFSFPSDIPIMQNASYYGPDEAAMEAFNAERDAAVSRMDALTEGERRAWFEANWAALQDGSLTMDDLP